MYSLGIMTLTRSPCELEKMSLFQDLKLKRRKVDSRCSSDGESVADTSTSSPDLVPPPSPTKMTDAATAHAALQGGNPTTPPSPDSTPHSYHLQHHHHHHQQLLQPKQEPTLDKMAGRLEDSGVFDGGGTASVIKTLPPSAMAAVKRSHSPPIRPAPPFSPSHQPPRPHSSPGRPEARASPVIRHAPLLVPTTPSPPRGNSHQHQQQPQQQQQQQEPTSSMSSSSSSSSPSYVSSKATKAYEASRGVIISQQQNQNQIWLQHSRINGVKPELIGGSFATPAFPSIKPELIGGTSAAFPDLLKGPAHHHHHHQQQQHHPQQQQQRPGTNLPPMRQAPTVIMGEAGGVRTMIWSQPLSPVDPQSIVHPTTSQWPNSVVTNTEENAAQMLLNLGQDRLRLAAAAAAAAAATSPRPPTTSPQSNSSSLNMEQLWANEPKTLVNQQTQALNLTSPPILLGSDMKPFLTTDSSSTSGNQQDQNDEEEQPMICMICEDKATGLHYGIITCEGCKGFFKRTVQNRRVYTCVADGNCEITKAQRNRCQYCRFKKCIEQGMVLQAVREDRMPGGRNSGAVYNLYKVKYKKHKKPSAKQQTPKQQQQHQQQHQQDKTLISSPHHFKQEHHQHLKQEHHQHLQQQQQQQQQQQFAGTDPAIPSNLVNGTILKTALTNPSEVIRLRQRLDSAVSSSRDRNFSIEYSLSMIKTLIDCDEFQDIATLQNLDELLDHNNDLSEKLRKIGDSIVLKLVQWTKRLPFYLELPVEVHTRLLTHKWHELLVLTTSAFQAIHNTQSEQFTTLADTDFSQEVEANLCTLQNCLRSMMGREITIEQLRQDVGLMIEKITHVTLMFKQIKLTMEEYVCLKVITMLNEVRPASNTGSNDLEIIHERYMMCLRVYTQHIYPQQTTRFQDLLVRLPEIQSAASLLLESKMFYVPFLLNSAIQR